MHKTTSIEVSNDTYLKVLTIVLKTLDSSIKDVCRTKIPSKNKSDEDALVISFYNRNDHVSICNHRVSNGDLLSTGTLEGIDIALMIAEIIGHKGSFYYVDEMFLDIQSEVEKYLLALMVDALGKNEQLFFTSHNTDLLDMGFPKYAYTFFRKDPYDHQITAIDASFYLKKDTESLRNAVENDLFQTAPNIDYLTRIEDFIAYENDK